jgi:hypothetical protein
MVDTTTTPANKTELLSYMRERADRLISFADALPDATWTGPTDAAGWTVKDHVAHLMYWDRAEIALLLHGTSLQQSTAMPDAIWTSGDFDAMNEWSRQSTQSESPAAIRAERDRVFAKLFEVVGSYSESDLARPVRDFGLDDSDRTLLAVCADFYGDHFEEHRRYSVQLVDGNRPS